MVLFFCSSLFSCWLIFSLWIGASVCFFFPPTFVHKIHQSIFFVLDLTQTYVVSLTNLLCEYPWYGECILMCNATIRVADPWFLNSRIKIFLILTSQSYRFRSSEADCVCASFSGDTRGSGWAAFPLQKKPLPSYLKLDAGLGLRHLEAASRVAGVRRLGVARCAATPEASPRHALGAYPAAPVGHGSGCGLLAAALEAWLAR